MAYAALFPGQGSQHVGMGADVLARLPELLGCDPDVILGFSITELGAGPADQLDRTDRAQPALLAVSLAYWALLRRVVPPPGGAAGHSLGEYAALAAGGAVGNADALALVAERGRAMWEASTATPSGMVALIGVDAGTADALCAARRGDGGKLWLANDNNPGQAVVAGGEADLAWLRANAAAAGVRRVIRLAVSGAFHTPFMAPAAVRLDEALAKIEVADAAFPIACNVDGVLRQDAGDLRRALGAQLTAPVRWQAGIRALAEGGVDTFVHVGPGDVTAQMVKRIDRRARVVVVNSVASVADAARALG